MKRMTCLLLTVAMLMCGAGQAGGMNDMGETMALVRAEALPEQDWQKTAAFPDWKGYTDDTLAMNSMLSFQGFHGQGTLWLEVPEGVEGFNLYVNGVRYDTSNAGPGVWSADLSAAATDGVNTLQVSNIRPLGLSEAVKVCVPYPEVLDADRGLEGISADSLRLVSIRPLSLEECLEFIDDDELLEVTPKNLRMRKRILNAGDRARQWRKGN